MLGGDHARHNLEQLGNAQDRAGGEVGAADTAGHGCIGDADLPLGASEHDDVALRGLEGLVLGVWGVV